MKSALKHVHVESRRRTEKTLQRDFPDATIVDVTSKGPEPWVRFSPFYPVGEIPVPMSAGRFSQSVEGIWQGLKVFDSVGVDASKLDVTAMKGLKRTVRRFGRVRGHAAGLDSTELLSYGDARRRIYLPAYRWALENRLRDPVERLRELASQSDIVLLDYETNCDIEDLTRPLSHAGLIRLYLTGSWPPP